MMPALSQEFGLLPWHFGGDQTLTYDETDAYVDAMRDISDARKRAARGNR